VPVIPAKAGISAPMATPDIAHNTKIPVFTGMTAGEASVAHNRIGDNFPDTGGNLPFLNP
jgi:hypothetical protein